MSRITDRCSSPMRHAYVTTTDCVIVAVKEKPDSAAKTAARLSRVRGEDLAVWASNHRLHPGQIVLPGDAVYCGQTKRSQLH